MSLIKLTRVYKLKNSAAVKLQSINVDAHAVESVRPSNRLEGQRATVTMRSGKEFEVTQKFSEVTAAINNAY